MSELAMAEPETAYVIRQPLESDRPFILDSWLRSRLHDLTRRDRRKNPWPKAKIHEWYAIHRPKVTYQLDRAQVLLAVDPSAPDFILGWIAWEGDELRYVYTKELFRGFGIARALRIQAGLAPQRL